MEAINKTSLNINYLRLNSHPKKCGYCGGKKKEGARSWGTASDKTRIDNYEIMMNRGWRRSGTFYYKTDPENSCCQLYTIRLNVNEFKISHKQKKALNKFNRFLNGELDYKLTEVKPIYTEEKKEELTITKKYEGSLSLIIIKAVLEILLKDKILSKELKFNELKAKIQTTKAKSQIHGDFATNAAIVLYNANKKVSEAKEEVSLSGVQKMIIEKIESSCLEQKFKVSAAENGFINFIADSDIKLILDKDIPLRDTKDEPKEKFKKSKLDSIKEVEEVKEEPQYAKYFKEFVPNKNPNPVHKYTVEIFPAIATQETFELYKAYQAYAHNSHKETMSGFKSFLTESPLYDPNNPEDASRAPPFKDDINKLKDQGIWPKYLGSYHMYHRIDGKLIAVGALDFTSSIASSVYFFYDPKYKFLGLGTVGSLREIEYIRRINELYNPSFKYYYLGYYIQDCIKSVYKGEYYPSYLLCPVTYTWVELEKVKKLIAEKKYARFADDGVEVIEDMKVGKKDIDNIVDNNSLIQSKNSIPLKTMNKSTLADVRILMTKFGKTILKDLVWTKP